MLTDYDIFIGLHSNNSKRQQQVKSDIKKKPRIRKLNNANYHPIPLSMS